MCTVSHIILLNAKNIYTFKSLFLKYILEVYISTVRSQKFSNLFKQKP